MISDIKFHNPYLELPSEESNKDIEGIDSRRIIQELRQLYIDAGIDPDLVVEESIRKRKEVLFARFRSEGGGLHMKVNGKSNIYLSVADWNNQTYEQYLESPRIKSTLNHEIIHDLGPGFFYKGNERIFNEAATQILNLAHTHPEMTPKEMIEAVNNKQIPTSYAEPVKWLLIAMQASASGKNPLTFQDLAQAYFSTDPEDEGIGGVLFRINLFQHTPEHSKKFVDTALKKIETFEKKFDPYRE